VVAPESGLFYARDLAYVHDAAFGDLARAGGASLIRLLGRAGFESGLVVELGCGSGITAQLLGDEGYDVLGIDVSEDLVEIARTRAPRAEFVCASLLDAEIPRCIAVAAIGECFNYALDGVEELAAVFRRVHAATEPGGLFLFDLAEPGRERGGPRRTWHEGEDWMLCLEASEDDSERTLKRRITVFRETDGRWARSDELHVQRLYDRQNVLDALERTGFEARQLGAYGRAVHFGRGHSGFLAVKRA
jgi:SAM-dependent methyltransferase